MRTFIIAATAASFAAAAPFDNRDGIDTRTDLVHREDGHGHTTNVGLPAKHGLIAKKAAGAKVCSSIKCYHETHTGKCGGGRKHALDKLDLYFQGDSCPTFVKPTSSIRVAHICAGDDKKWGGRECKESVCKSGHFCGMDGNNGCVCVELHTSGAVEEKTTKAPCKLVDCTKGWKLVGADDRGCGGTCEKEAICCKAMTASCLACAAEQTIDKYCLANPKTPGCPALELLSDNQSGTWSVTGTDTFRLGDAKHNRHAYRKTFVGSSSGGGLCAAPGSSYLEVDVTMLDSTDRQTSSKGNYAAISMRANAAKGTLGYQCRISTAHGDNGISLTRDGKSLTHACPRIDQNNGVMNRYSTGYDSKVPGPYTYHELCQIQERSKAASLFSKDKKYTLRMDLVEDADLNTVRVSCSVDGVTKLYFTDPCPLESGELALDAKYQSSFHVTDYTKMTCDALPKPAALVPSLADGLTLTGMGRTATYWASKNLAASNMVAHRYAGGCNNGAYPYGASNHPGAAGFNREGGGRSNSALNVAALSSGTCVKNGFIEADVSFRGDFLGIANGYRKVSATDTHIDENQRTGVAGIAMRVDSTNNGQAKGNAYDSFGYMCQMTARNGQVTMYRGRNGAHHNYNGIGSAYLSGRYRCKECTCKTKPSDASCTQFGFASGGWNPSAKHTLRLEVANDADGHPHVKCSLDGVTILSVVDKRQGRHKWFPTSARSPGPSTGTNSCGDFGLVTSDSDVVEYTVKDYTGKA